MTRYFSVLLVCSLAAGCAARPAPVLPSSVASVAPPPEATPLIMEASVRAHLEFLAGDALNGRGSGTRDEWIAATYAASHMRQAGLEPLGDDGSFVQTIEMEHREASAPPVLSFANGRFTHGERMIVVSMAGGRISGSLQKPKGGEAVTPASVVLLPAGVRTGSMPGIQSASVVLTAETAQARAAWATLAERTPATRPEFTAFGDKSPRRPTTIVLERSAYETVAALADGTAVTFEAELGAPMKTQTWNAVGRLRGTGAAAEDVILLSAHLDHIGARGADSGTDGTADRIYNGADDDASGTVAVLELAKGLAAGPRPDRTIVFALFGSEEQGGVGSRFFAGRPPVPLSQFVANLQFEMIGRPDTAVPSHTLWLTGYERSNLGPELARHGARLVQDPHPEQNFFERSDNIQFARRGVVAHTVSSYGLHTDYHQPSDEVRHIDVPHMTDAIRSLLAPIQWLANSTFKPEWVPGGQPQSR